MAAKLSNKIVVLCSTAIGIVYTAGYMVTAPLAANQGDFPALSAEAAAASDPAKQFPPVSVPAQQSHSATGKSNAAAAAKSSKFVDGTYTGRGSNRIGSVEVAVTVKNDRITSVKITNCTTSYSQSYIDKLPEQVLSRQNSKVDVVSGATRSTENFQSAVERALAQAKV